MSMATGDHVLLLNNDVEVMEPGWLKEMVACLAYPDTGIVGARLLYPDGSAAARGRDRRPRRRRRPLVLRATRFTAGSDGQADGAPDPLGGHRRMHADLQGVPGGDRGLRRRDVRHRL